MSVTSIRNPQSDRPGGLRIDNLAHVATSPPKWLVRDLIERNSLSMFFGDPGVGKSFLAVELACCIASGEEFHGRAVSKGPVVYFNGEGHSGFTRRIAAWQRARSIELTPTVTDASGFEYPDPASRIDNFCISNGPLALARPETKAEIIPLFTERWEGPPPSLFVTDTLSCFFGAGKDPNSSQDMQVAVDTCHALQDATGATILLIHHPGHSDKYRPRGAHVLLGALDAAYRVSKDATDCIRLQNTKMKDFDAPTPMTFNLERIELGMRDETGEAVASAVMNLIEEPASLKPAQSGRGKWQSQALKSLEKLRSHTSDIITCTDWRRACVGAGMPRQRWHEVRKSLADAGLVHIDGEIIRPES